MQLNNINLPDGLMLIMFYFLFFFLIYQDLLDPARWKMLIQQFRYDNYRLHQLGNNSVFTITLQAGLSAIKTPYPSSVWLLLTLSFQLLKLYEDG